MAQITNNSGSAHALQNGDSKTVTNLTSGAVAAVCATLLTQPTDMLRTHMQVCAATASYALDYVYTL